MRLVDLDDHTQIECICRNCGHTRYEHSTDLAVQEGFAQIHIRDVEQCLRCAKRSRPGPVSVALMVDE